MKWASLHVAALPLWFGDGEDCDQELLDVYRLAVERAIILRRHIVLGRGDLLNKSRASSLFTLAGVFITTGGVWVGSKPVAQTAMAVRHRWARNPMSSALMTIGSRLVSAVLRNAPSLRQAWRHSMCV